MKLANPFTHQTRTSPSPNRQPYNNRTSTLPAPVTVEEAYGVSHRMYKAEEWFGRIGFFAKGVVYCLIGGMAAASGAHLMDNEANDGDARVDASPQGAFVLIGGVFFGKGLLIALFAGIVFYAIWRLWEGLTFQGADATLSKFKNFFQYRLSPLVSCAVYAAYAYYLARLLVTLYKSPDGTPPPSSSDACLPACWLESTGGRVGVVLLATAFLIATITQLLNAFTRKWYPELDPVKIRSPFQRYLILTLGHIGFLGRAGIFLFVSALMWKGLRGGDDDEDEEGFDPEVRTMMGSGLNLLRAKKAGQVTLIVIGAMVVTYGVFAALCGIWFRRFPTPPPSGRPLRKKRRENGRK
ncbi:hypothetical protein HDV00_008065 [Rhizophlyctis rosea]|nr:hypothetical protein HDV00_008065 [Rhizophlyctis rosea]